jgi:hypothetical protein
MRKATQNLRENEIPCQGVQACRSYWRRESLERERPAEEGNNSGF